MGYALKFFIYTIILRSPGNDIQILFLRTFSEKFGDSHSTVLVLMYNQTLYDNKQSIAML